MFGKIDNHDVFAFSRLIFFEREKFKTAGRRLFFRIFDNDEKLVMAAADWEAIKENARPLRTGYKMSSLTSLLASPPPVSKLAEQQRAFEAAVAANGGHDPLAVWREYISWAELNSATADVAIDTASLLERCVVQFRQYPEYKNDPRYVKIALKYVRLVVILLGRRPTKTTAK